MADMFGSPFNGVFNNFGKELIQSDSLKDWSHASKTFVAGKYALAPKQSYLYFVGFDINANVGITGNGMTDVIKQIELGVLVKSIGLPKYTIDTKSLNAYNRPHVIQTKMHYDPISIVFHDDYSDTVRNFWYDYYTYYYRNSDGLKSDSSMSYAHGEITNVRDQKDWGYTIRNAAPATLPPYLSAVRIYSLHNKQFSEYKLYNPIIKSFQHGDHEAGNATGIMQHTMSIEFESVQYARGVIGQYKDGKTNITEPIGFGDLHYDKSPSPITPAGGGTKSILGTGGVLDSAGDISSDLSSGNYGAALFKGAKVGNNLNGVNLGAIAGREAIGLTKGVLGGSANPFGTITVPTKGSANNK